MHHVAVLVHRHTFKSVYGKHIAYLVDHDKAVVRIGTQIAYETSGRAAGTVKKQTIQEVWTLQVRLVGSMDNST